MQTLLTYIDAFNFKTHKTESYSFEFPANSVCHHNYRVMALASRVRESFGAFLHHTHSIRFY